MGLPGKGRMGVLDNMEREGGGWPTQEGGSRRAFLGPGLTQLGE